MHNQVYLIGRLVKEPEITETAAIITLRVKRAWKNENGEYDTDDFEIVIPGAMGNRASEYLKPGNLVGIKGRLQKKDNIEVVADKVTVLGTREEEKI